MQYEFDAEGRLRLTGCSREIVLEREANLAILFLHDNDGSEPTSYIMRHGHEKSVQAYHRSMWAACNQAANDIHATQEGKLSAILPGGIHTGDHMRAMADGLELLCLPVSTLTDEALAEINACLNTTGRVVNLRKHLDALAVSSQPGPQP